MPRACQPRYHARTTNFVQRADCLIHPLTFIITASWLVFARGLADPVAQRQAEQCAVESRVSRIAHLLPLAVSFALLGRAVLGRSTSASCASVSLSDTRVDCQTWARWQ